MTPRIWTVALTLAVATVASAHAFGGWAVITVKDLPATLTVGAPTALTFTIRQHGEDPMRGLKPVVEARLGGMIAGTTVEAAAVPGKVPGQYTATLSVPKPGEWRITIKSGFVRNDLRLLPIRAHEGTTTVAALAGAELGRHLFVAKGCVACHVHSAVETQGAASSYGPNLTDKRFDATYLALWLANPAIRPPTKPGQAMPNMDLAPQEVSALVAFVNARQVASSR